MNRNHYSRKKVTCIALGIVLAMIAVFAVIEIRTEPAQAWDIVCPMANAKIDWQQSYHAGAPEVGK